MISTNPNTKKLAKVVRGLMLTLAAITVGTNPRAQSFSSESDGSDGALTVAANQGTIVFDPFDAARWGKVLDPDGDGVYNFTTITISSGSTLRVQGDKVNRPVYFLASGDVVISGTLDASGAAGVQTFDLSLRRVVAVPGPGGFAGGAGGVTSGPPASSGEGPGGGAGAFNCVYNISNSCGKGGTFSGNRYNVPPVGGSGGEGGTAPTAPNRYVGGGAGGGSILVASSTLIAVNGSVAASGGGGGLNTECNCTTGGSGSGGGIRLVAPVLSGAGTLNVAGGTGSYAAGNGGAGLVRLEALQISGAFVFTAGGAFVTRGSPVDPSTLRPASTVRVTAIDGVPVPAHAAGSFAIPDVTITRSTPVNVDIQATGIPPGTVVTLQVYPQTPTDLATVNFPTAQATLAGTLQLSTATAQFTFPYGFSRGWVRASWTQ